MIVVDTNIIGVINGSRVAYHQMSKQGYGQIFNMEGFGSDGMVMSKMGLYGLSKRAVRYYSRSLAKEANGSNILIGRLSPGMVVTDLLLSGVKGNDEESQQARKIFNILADRVETVTPYLYKQMIQNKQNDRRISWLTKRKIMVRFLTAPLKKRQVIE